jgi:bacteriocin biosynthesis cyclodehydratase domain-containing protein
VASKADHVQESRPDASSVESDLIALAPRYRPLCRSGERLILAAEDEVRCIDEPVIADIVAVLQHANTIAQIEESLSRKHPISGIRAALGKMSEEGLLAATSRHPPEIAAYWNSVGGEATGLLEVGFQPIEPRSQGIVRQALLADGVHIAPGAPFLLVTADDYLRPDLAEINLRSQPWLLAKPVGYTIWMGPLFVPGRTACWSCLARWLKPHRWAQAAFYGWGDTDFPPQPSTACLPTTLGLAAGMIATTVAIWLTKGEYPELENTILTFDTRTLRSSRNLVRTHPQCPHCRPAARFPIGRHKSLHEFVSPITSVVSMMEVTDKPVGGFFHAHAICVPPLPLATCRPLLRPQHAAAKALTSQEAETACIAEALERYSIIYQGSERHLRATFEEIDAIDPSTIQLFSDAQYEERISWNRSHSELHWVPERFDSSAAMDWTETKSLVSGKTKYVPTALCYMHYACRDHPIFCAADTNGCAAGPSLTGAILHAILELVERDSVAIWWYNRISRPALDLKSLGDKHISDIERIFEEMGRRLYVLDLTTDIRIPAFVAIAPRLDGSEPCFGAAAGFSARRAAFKAIAETAQICFWTANGSGSDEMHSWIRGATVDSHRYLLPSGTIEAPAEQHMDPAEALQWSIGRLTGVGIEPYYVDLTRPEIGLPVVRAIAPGLRHFWARLGPGRLFDVPVSLGWRDTVLSESDLNPTPCMI